MPLVEIKSSKSLLDEPGHSTTIPPFEVIPLALIHSHSERLNQIKHQTAPVMFDPPVPNICKLKKPPGMSLDIRYRGQQLDSAGGAQGKCFCMLLRTKPLLRVQGFGRRRMPVHQVSKPSFARLRPLDPNPKLTRLQPRSCLSAKHISVGEGNAIVPCRGGLWLWIQLCGERFIERKRPGN
jgi:hypothetical protein